MCACNAGIMFYLPRSLYKHTTIALILSEIEVLDKEYPINMPDKKDMVNFQRCRNFTRAIQHVQRYQSIPYQFHTIEV